MMQIQTTTLKEAAEMLKKTSTDRFKASRKKKDIIAIINNGLEGSDEKSKLTEMNKSQEGLMKQLQTASGDYNTLAISKAPASFVASVFGFRKILIQYLDILIGSNLSGVKPFGALISFKPSGNGVWHNVLSCALKGEWPLVYHIHHLGRRRSLYSLQFVVHYAFCSLIKT